MPATVVVEPVSMTRAKSWDIDVENAFRFQCAGWRSQEEYTAKYPQPERWTENNFVSTLQTKGTGYFMYFRRHRECLDKYIHRVKLYKYA